MTTASELERIRAEYARRRRELPHDQYSLARPLTQFFHYGISRACIRLLSDADLFPFDSLRIADIGCGSGRWLAQFLMWGASPDRLSGIDTDEQRIANARQMLPAADIRAGNAAELPWPDASFDVVSQFTVFTSILDPGMKRAVAREMMRVVRPGGCILWYDFRVNNPRNSQVRGIPAGEIRSLFAPWRATLQSVTLAPPIARAVTPVSWPLAAALECIPFLRTHTVALIRPA